MKREVTMQAPQSHPLDLNILPERYRPRRITASMVGVFILVLALVVGLLPTYDVLTAAQAETVHLRSQLSQAKKALAQAQSEKAQLEEQVKEVEQQIERAQAQSARLRAELNALSQQRTPLAVCVEAAIAALIPRVHIATIIQEGDAFIIGGQAGSQGLVLDYARALQGGGQFANVRITSMVNSDSLGLVPEVEFSIEVEQ